MKRIGNIYDSIISLENLQIADNKARKGKSRSYGVKHHDKNRESNLLQLHEDLKNQRFTNSKYQVFKIYEPKEREIYRLPYWPDRIVPTKEVYKQQICSWWGWCKYCNSIHLISKIQKLIPHEIKFIKARRKI